MYTLTLVTCYNMHSVTSNAVAEALNGLIKYKDIEIGFASLHFVQYKNGGYYCNIPVSSYLSNWSQILAITTRYWTALDCRGFYLGFDTNMTYISIIVATYSTNGVVTARIVYI